MICSLRPGVALEAALALLAVGCADGGAEELTLRAESSSGDAEVSYRVDGGDLVTETVSTPWEYTIEVGGAFEVELTVTNLSESGTVFCGVDHAGSTLVNPSANGELAADCSVTGRSQGGTLTMSSNTFGTPFGEALADSDEGALTEPAADAADAAVVPDGMSATLVFSDRNGDPIEPAQFDRVWVSIVVEGALGADDVQVSVEGEIDDGATVVSLNSRERKDADDIDSTGRLVHILRVIDLGQPGTLRAEFEGKVKVDDIDIPVDDLLVIDIAPTETVIETRELSGGFVTLDVASIALTDADEPAQRSAGSDESWEFTLRALRDVAAVSLGNSDLAVFRVEQSMITTVEEVADFIEGVFAEAGDVERVAAEVDGRDALRIEFDADRSGTVDVLLVDGEILVVQARWETGAGDEIRAARDSLRFDPSQLLPSEG